MPRGVVDTRQAILMQTYCMVEKLEETRSNSDKTKKPHGEYDKDNYEQLERHSVTISNVEIRKPTKVVGHGQSA